MFLHSILLDIRKVISVVLMASICAAGVLIADPSVHASQHDEKYHQSSNQTDDDNCHVCQILDHFVLGSLPSLSLEFPDDIFTSHVKGFYQGPFLSAQRSSLVPRAPPVL